MTTETWHWLDTGDGNATMNMAIDEALLQGIDARGVPLFRVYGWNRPSISIGYFQEYPADYEDDYAIVRRPTGGGLVWHGKDLTFTIVVPPAHAIHEMRGAEGYRAIHEMIVRGLNRAGIQCALSGEKPASAMGACFELPVTHDIMVGPKKIAGGAQRRTKFGLLHQGSLLLPPSQRQPLTELASSLRAGLGVSCSETRLTETELATAKRLASSKYSTPAWNRKFIPGS